MSKQSGFFTVNIKLINYLVLCLFNWLLLSGCFMSTTTLSAEMPIKVAESARKVVSVILPFSKNFEIDLLCFTDESTLNRIGFDAIYTAIQSRMETNHNFYTLTFLESQLQYCKINKLKKCIIYDRFARGSGFFVNSTDELVISHHVLKRHIDSLLESNGTPVKVGLPIQITVVDSSGKILYSPLDDGQATVKYLTKDVMSLASGRIANLVDDFAIIQLPKHVGQKLKMAETGSNAGETVFNVGVSLNANRPQPRLTEFHKLNGTYVIFTQGMVLSPNTAFALFGARPKCIDDRTHDFFSKNLVISTAAAIKGNSGGPVLNSSGEVVGIQVKIWRLVFSASISMNAYNHSNLEAPQIKLKNSCT